MAREKASKRLPNTGSESVPPGATRKAADRERSAGGGPPGGGAGPRHASGDAGAPNESFGPSDTNQPLGEAPNAEELDALEKGPPYAGSSGGAVGGTPAEKRSKGGRTRGGIAPGSVHRGDSTVGADPDNASD
jgi:hypothetical protein